MRKNVVKKVTAVTLAATLAFGSLISAFADLGITGGTGTYGVASASASASANPSSEPTTTPPTPSGENTIINTTITDTVEGAWWTGFTDYYTVKGNFDLTLKFKVFGGSGVWNNFAAVFTTDADRAAEGYSEFAVVRGDNWGWGGGDNFALGGSPITYQGGIADMTDAEFIAMMKEAEITANVKRNGNTFTYTYTAKGANGKETTRVATFTADAPDTMRVFFVADSSKLTKPGTTQTTTSPTTKPTTKPTTSPTKTPSVNKTVAPKKVELSAPGYLKATSITLKVKGKATITASITPKNATNKKITATSSKKKVATVKVKGSKVTITGKKAGTAKVTIASAAKKSVKKVVTVKVVKKAVKAKKVTVKKKTLTIKRGKSATIGIKKITPKNYTDTIKFKVTKKLKGVSVDNTGKVKVTNKAKKGKKAVVTVSVGKKAKAKVTIKVK